MYFIYLFLGIVNFIFKIIKIKKTLFYLIIILLFIFTFFKLDKLIKDYKENFNYISKMKYDEISIVINMKNLTNDKHILFNEVLRKFNSTRKFYFIKTLGQPLNENLSKLVENTSIKIIQSNFPDTIFLPLVASLYGKTIPELVLLIEGDELMDISANNLVKWINNAYKLIMRNGYDYIFGNFKIIKGKKIGNSLLFSKASIIQHLLFYTDSDTSHANPFIQLSFATKTKFCFIPLNYIKSSNIENTHNRFSSNMNCPSTDDKNMPSLCVMIPSYKRNYFSYSFPAFFNQTYKPKFYIVIQNDNRMYLNLSLIQKMVNEPIYHIWMQNWNSFFFLNLRFSSVLPCNFIIKYDDDQWPKDNTLQQRLINKAKGKNVIIGRKGYLVKKSFCGYSPKNIRKTKTNIVDHCSVPILIRPGYIKLDARNNIYRLYGGEDISLSLNSRKLCNTISKRMRMKLIERQRDGNNQAKDKQIISEYKNDKENKFKLFTRTYCYLIHSGYMPRQWAEFQIPKKEYLNITIKHKSLN